MWYQNIRSVLFGFVIKNAFDRHTDGRTDGRTDERTELRQLLRATIAARAVTIIVHLHFSKSICANQTLSEATVFVYATSAYSSITRRYDDVIVDVTGAVAEQQCDADCKQEILR